MEQIVQKGLQKDIDYESTYALENERKEFKKDMGWFGKYCFPTALAKDTPEFHRDIYKELKDEETKRVLIAAPRGTAKSTVCSLIFPLYKIAHKKETEDLFIVIVSESQAQSINFLSRIKYHLEHSDNFRHIFGDFSSKTARRWTNTDVVLRNGTRIIAVGTGQRVRGFIEGDTRPNVIIVDDFESELNAFTPEGRTKNRKWMTEAVIPSLSDEGRIIMIGTVISEDCFLYWAKDSPAWKTLWYSIWDEDEKSIWEQRFPKERILQIKSEFESVGNINGFFQEYMNIAQSPDDAPFKPNYINLHHYDFEIINQQSCLVREVGDEKKIIPVELYTGVDPASSLSARADYFVIATIAIDADNNKYVVDIFRKRLDPAKQPQKIIDIFERYHPKRMKIETVAYQEALRSATRAIMLEKNLYIPGLEKGVKPRTRKSERLLSLVPAFAKGEFFFRSEDLAAQQEFLSYPRGKNDDIMDAIWTALEGARPCRVKRKDFDPSAEVEIKSNIILDWLTM
jgi:predicted phage terminase large subunit-like protein|tara:strand:+ start:213 stop:1748 length:1536 start_codon:yes stop_codon:yes gene_type:complete